MTKEQERLYAEMRDEMTTQLESGAYVTATVVIAQMVRLHQILCGYVGDEVGVRHEVSENRTGELLQLLDDYAGKAVVWCAYGHSINLVSETLRREYGADSVAHFWGGNERTRESEEKRFKTDPACRWLVATAAARGRGRTWDVADLVVYHSNTDDLDHRMQSEERVHAIGKTTPVTYVDLMVPGTVDEKIIHALRNKLNLSAVITGDNYREWLV
jgi:Superfamily II DNA/RNA helicases, SNF2 family